MIHQNQSIAVIVVSTGSVFQLEGGGREEQSYADKQEEDCDASKPRSGALVLHKWIDDARSYGITRKRNLSLVSESKDRG
jgi:hypothetical protein